MIEKIIRANQLQNTRINSYGFKPLSTIDESDDEFQMGIVLKPQHYQENIETQVIQQDKSSLDENIDIIHNETEEKENFIESLMKKIDDLSTSLIKMEMQLEKQQGEFNTMLKDESERAFKEGFSQGESQTLQTHQSEVEQLRRNFSESMMRLAQSQLAFEEKTHTLEKELVLTSLSIAKEVIVSEVHENSSNIAFSLATTLLKEVSGAANVTLRVNPKDYDFVKAGLTTQHFESLNIIPDNVISQGGVIVYSDSANIDGTIMTRFENIKNSIISQKGKE